MMELHTFSGKQSINRVIFQRLVMEIKGNAILFFWCLTILDPQVCDHHLPITFVIYNLLNLASLAHTVRVDLIISLQTRKAFHPRQTGKRVGVGFTFREEVNFSYLQVRVKEMSFRFRASRSSRASWVAQNLTPFLTYNKDARYQPSLWPSLLLSTCGFYGTIFIFFIMVFCTEDLRVLLTVCGLEFLGALLDKYLLWVACNGKSMTYWLSFLHPC